MKVWGQKQKGFTVVELLIVIVVIAILATITIVGYSMVQNNARDTKRATDLKKLSEAISLWSLETKKMPEQSGTGYGGNGFGWVYGTGYAKSLETLLVEGGYLSGETRDPSIPTGTGSYMFYRCGTTATNDQNMTYGLMARFNNPDRDGNQYAEWQAQGCATGAATTYGMNYIRIIKY